MTSRDEEFLRLLRSTFKVEADEHLHAISTGLIEFEKTSGSGQRRAIVEKVFRAAHTLKGAARAVDFTEVESVCQSMEEVFASWKREESTASPASLDMLHRAIDAIRASLSAPATSSAVQSQLASLRRSLSEIGTMSSRSQSGERPEMTSPVVERFVEEGKANPAPDETIRIAVAKLETHLLEAEEILTAKLVVAKHANDLRELAERVAAWRKTSQPVEADVRELRQARGITPAVTRMLDFFDTALEAMKSLESSVLLLGREADNDRQAVGKLVDDLLENSKNLLLMPFSTISAALPKLVRDLCRDQGKEADFFIHGEDMEIDRRILEEIKDPVIHLLRNTIDHGIEPPEERVRRGKPRRATITIAVSQIDGSKVQLMLSDDGGGIDVQKVKDAAVRLALITPDDAAALDDAAARDLIFESALSTSPAVTAVSGRGLGLAIVREKAEKLGGEVAVESEHGVGTMFRLVIPATRATFRGILLETSGRVVVVPTKQVEHVSRVRPEHLHTIEGRETIPFEGRAVPVVPLAGALGIPSHQRLDGAGTFPVVILGHGDSRVAYAVDAVLAEEEVLVKPLRAPLLRVWNVAAATVLASGQIAPILNVADLLKSARKGGSVAQRLASPAKTAPIRSILVAEDSITSRMLLKSILESAGYRVKTAVDGLEAFTLLRSEHFDLVVSDVEMPRLGGFDLTARIRDDPKLAELPVVLVTALDKREDRERGVDVGANAYIVKGSFDQSNLLEAVRRLI